MINTVQVYQQSCLFYHGVNAELQRNALISYVSVFLYRLRETKS